jgi:hypothetical protein
MRYYWSSVTLSIARLRQSRISLSEGLCFYLGLVIPVAQVDVKMGIVLEIHWIEYYLDTRAVAATSGWVDTDPVITCITDHIVLTSETTSPLRLE